MTWWRKRPAQIFHVGSLTLNVLALANRVRSEAPNGFNQPIDAFTPSERFVEAMGELGEAANVLKKLNRITKGGARANKEGEEALREKLKLELGDTLIALDLICQRLGLKLEDCVITAFNSKSAEIGYEGRL